MMIILIVIHDVYVDLACSINILFTISVSSVLVKMATDSKMTAGHV